MTSRQVCWMGLCSLLILGVFIDSTQSVSCCLNYIRHKISCKRLLDYSVQNMNQLCDLDAIIFHVPGRYLCANPASKETKRAIQCINDRKKKAALQLKQENEVASKSA